jgi:hypothetical protein
MEFISGTSRCNHYRSERLAGGVRVADNPLKQPLADARAFDLQRMELDTSHAREI